MLGSACFAFICTFFSNISEFCFFSYRSDIETRQAMENLIGHVMTSTTQVPEYYTINDKLLKWFKKKKKESLQHEYITSVQFVLNTHTFNYRCLIFHILLPLEQLRCLARPAASSSSLPAGALSCGAASAGTGERNTLRAQGHGTRTEARSASRSIQQAAGGDASLYALKPSRPSLYGHSHPLTFRVRVRVNSN